MQWYSNDHVYVFFTSFRPDLVKKEEDKKRSISPALEPFLRVFRNRFLYGFMFVSIYIIESVYLFAVNAKTTARIDAKRSGITKNNLESVLCRLKSPVLVFLERYRDISVFPLRSTANFTGYCLGA